MDNLQPGALVFSGDNVDKETRIARAKAGAARAKRCKGVSLTGAPCSSLAKWPTEFCHTHQRQAVSNGSR